MDITKLTFLRNLARKTGLIRLLSAKGRRQDRQARKYYETHQPELATISLLGYTYKLRTGSAYEWMRANAVYRDEHILKALFSALEDPEDCWDIGASIGAYSCLLGMKISGKGTVYAFEPELKSREKLESNIRLNALSNIKVYDVALGKEESELTLLLADDTTAGTHKLEPGADAAHQPVQQVKVMTMDKLIKQDSLKIPGTMKIDVEGWEEQVLLGGRQTIASPACKAIMIEMHFSIYAAEKDSGRAARITQLLQESGFTKLTWVDPSHLFATK